MSEKTEQPTSKKLRDARQKGQVAKSQSLTQTALLVCLFGYFSLRGGHLVEAMKQMMLAPMALLQVEFQSAVDMLATSLLIEALWLLLPFLGIVLVVGTLAEALQTQFLVSFGSLKQGAQKLNVASNLKNLFSLKSVVELVKATLKLLLLTVIVTLVVRNSIGLLFQLPYGGVSVVAPTLGHLMDGLLLHMTVTFAILAAIDYAWQRRTHIRGLMMTKDEVKQEYKQDEGDPHLKHGRKHLHRELLETTAVKKAASATALITNPTHLAIALHYVEDSTPLPLVLAKGEGALAERMISAARTAGVPVMQNIPLAHALFAEGRVDQYIPSELIEPVAEVLKLVRELLDAPGPDEV